MTTFADTVISGLLTGAVYSLIAAGLALEFGVLRVVNFAHGYMVMLSMYVLATLSSSYGWSPYVSLIICVPAAAAAGTLLYLGVIRPFIRKGASPLVVALGSLAVSVFIEQGVLQLSGAQPRPVRMSISLKGWTVLGIHLSVVWVIAALVSTAVMALLALALRTTRWGRNARAVAQDPAAAAVLGINPSVVSASVFAVGTILALVAGAMLVTLVPADPHTGLTYSQIAIIIVTLGGLSSFTGAWLGGLVIGVASNLVAFYWDPSVQSLVYLAVFVIVLSIRPQGLFGHRGDVGAIHA